MARALRVPTLVTSSRQPTAATTLRRARRGRFYIDFLVKNGVHENRPALRDALKSLGKLSHADDAAGASKARPPSEEAERAGRYVLTFGKHGGNALADVPDSYLGWLARAGVAAEKGEGLDEALRSLGYDVLGKDGEAVGGGAAAADKPADDERRFGMREDDIPF